jgi:hypothetical protein
MDRQGERHFPLTLFRSDGANFLMRNWQGHGLSLVPNNACKNYLPDVCRFFHGGGTRLPLA